MNRRHFIKSAAIASVITPTIVKGINPVIQPEKVRLPNVEDFINILTIEELQRHGIRSAIYSASCVDKNGRFAHKRGYCDLWLRDSGPFVRQTFRIQCLPKVYSFVDDTPYIHSIVARVRSGIKLGFGGQEYSRENVIHEIKQKMEYVCLVWYCSIPCLCGRNSCKSKTWIPVVGGLSKHRYNLYLKQLNGLI
jgi:hypothetical protein